MIWGCSSDHAEAPASPLEWDFSTDFIRITHGGNPVLTYALTPQLPEGEPEYYRRSGFIHPAYSPAGKVITDDFPVGHAHQHGIFSAWVNTDFRGEFHDFWNQQKKTGTAEHLSVLDTLRTDSSLILRFRLQQRSLQFGPVIQEDWTLEVYDRADPYVWDLTSEQLNVSQDTLFIKDHLYGGLGVRGNRRWNEADSLHFTGSASFLTSEGMERDSANHSRPLWTAIYGSIEGETAGLAVIPAATNFRHPVPVRVHPQMPYLAVAPMVGQAFTIAPGERYNSQYRFLVFDGPPPVDMLNRETASFLGR